MFGTILRLVLDRKGAAPEHDVMLAVVAAPDVASFPAFMPPVMSPANVGGLNRRTTRTSRLATPRRSYNRPRADRHSGLNALRLLDAARQPQPRERRSVLRRRLDGDPMLTLMCYVMCYDRMGR
jgi:hypothetical protein